MTSREDTFTTFDIQTWLPDLILGINPFGIISASSVRPEVFRCLGNNKVISSLSIDRQLLFRITAWQTLRIQDNKARENWEEGHKVHMQLFHCSESSHASSMVSKITGNCTVCLTACSGLAPNNKEKLKLCITEYLWGESTGDPRKGPIMRNDFPWHMCEGTSPNRSRRFEVCIDCYTFTARRYGCAGKL